MPEFTPFNDVKMEDPAESETLKGTMEDFASVADSCDGSAKNSSEISDAEPNDANESDYEEEKPQGKGGKGRDATKPAKGKATNGKAANGKKTANGKKAVVKMENEIKSEEDADEGAKKPVTPRKRSRNPKAANVGGNPTADEADDEIETPSKKRNTPAKGTPGKAAKRPLPNSIEEASAEDRMLLHMKDNENKPWGEIKAAWDAMTGENMGASTLSGRYQRIKANFAVFSAEDFERMLKIKQDIEMKFETEKWNRIADSLESVAGKRYPPAALLKKFKESSKKKAGSNGATVKAENGDEDDE